MGMRLGASGLMNAPPESFCPGTLALILRTLIEYCEKVCHQGRDKLTAKRVRGKQEDSCAFLWLALLGGDIKQCQMDQQRQRDVGFWQPSFPEHFWISTDPLSFTKVTYKLYFLSRGEYLCGSNLKCLEATNIGSYSWGRSFQANLFMRNFTMK